jgi:hypothetical protein
MICHADFRGSDSTKITLGKEVVKVVNDGGLGIYHRRGRGFTRWNYDPPQRDPSGVTRKHKKLAKSKPVLSFKVFFPSLLLLTIDETNPV